MNDTQTEPTMQTINAPYEIPVDWKWETLGNVANYINGRAFKPEEWEKEGLPIVRIQNLTNSSTLCNRSTKKFEKKYLIKNDDLLFAWSASLGAHIWNGGNAWLNQHIFNVIPNNNMEKKFLYYYLLQVVDFLYSKTHGTGMVHITLKPFKETPIPLPPLETQKAIVTKIETLFADLDSARDKVQHVLETSGERKAAILHQAFTGKLTAKWREENGVTLDDWQEKTLGDVAIPVKDKYNPNTDEKINLPYIGLEHIEKNNGLCGQGNIEEVKSLKTLFKNGDILYGKLRPYLDKHDIADFDGVCSTDILVYRTNESNTTKYINYLFGTSTFIQYAVENSNGINLPRTSEKAISSFSISLPPLAEQTEIVDLLDSLLGAEKTIAQNCQSVLDKIQDIKKAVLAKAFRGLL